MRYRDIPIWDLSTAQMLGLDSIWVVGAYTTHLNMQEYLWDGIKRQDDMGGRHASRDSYNHFWFWT